MQVYKYFDIGSAKIKRDEMENIPHYMIDVVEPTVNLNVKDFKDMAYKYIEDIYSRKKIPILVGGTGFYIRAVLYDTDFLFENEEDALNIRNELYNLLETKGIKYIYDKLKAVDEESANSIPIENERRIVRALEFYRLHNFPISRHNREEKEKESVFDFDFFVLNCNRDILYDRINKRVDKMMDDGFLEEVENLIKMGIDKKYNSMKSIGYSELYDYIKGINRNLDESVELIKQHTRNYAKRQLTWFRGQENIKWVNL